MKNCKVCNDTKQIEVIVMGTDTDIVECYYCNSNPVTKEIKLEKFKQQMQIELDANAHKGNWEDFLNEIEIGDELQYHLEKLNFSMVSVNKEKIKEHIADCANLLMMLGNAYGLYD